nr:RNA-directed DNA polymerase, eukaryota, reverse transcriptase zinc-binding domain protein [Tanacetum cinerariifolium]
MSSGLFFYISSDDEEVNSELAAFTEACQAAYEASKPKVHRTPVERDHYGTHDRLVMTFTSKEDDVAKISTSIFVTNFPEECSPKDLFIACKQYGRVVDSFIPVKRSKVEGRIVWVEIEGIPFKLWSNNTFKRIASKWGDLLDIDDQEDKCIFDSSKRSPWVGSYFLEEYDEDDLSDDGFRDVDSKKKNLETFGDDNDLEEDSPELNNNLEQSLKYPPGFTPNVESDTLDVNKEDNSSKIGHTGNDLLIVAVYGPQDLGEKRRLWDYLVHVIHKWHGEMVIMGDFNEVRFKSDRFGSVFNSQGANAFNSFIANAGLEEIPLGGSAFTWCHKSATKMSKLDRFLISKNLLSTCSNITAVTLDRYLSDHRPILLRESQFDYGPIPFRFWKIIESDVFEAVKQFFTLGKFPKGCNSCFIALILKIPDANLVKDFRPISLIGSLYKIIAKILANRLVGVLGDIVDEVQSAFIADRQILDGPFILNETLQWCKLKKKPSLIFKVDFEKAYDSVRWDFLDDILRKFGFGDKCLHLSFQRVVDAGLFKGIQLSLSVNISHKFYADDVMFMGQWCDGNINTLVQVLECFYRASGLRINMSKSRIMVVLVDREKIRCAAAKLGCLILKLPFSYLGTHVGGTMSRVQAWNDVVDKVQTRLPKWKLNTLSIGGRVIKAIHGEDGKVRKVDHSGSYFCWLNIVHEINKLEKQGIKLLDHMKVKLGNGDKVTFWEDTWNRDKAFKNLYPRIYALESLKLASVGMKLESTSLDSSFRRKPRGGIEQEQFDALADQIRDVILAPTPDRWVATKTRWIKVVPIKVNVHAWKVNNDYLPTRFNISSRGIDIAFIMSPFCSNGVETSSHLFFSCNLARTLTRRIIQEWDISDEEFNAYEEWLSWIVNIRLPSKKKMMLEDDEDEVNSELVAFTEACQAAYEASKPKVHRTPVERDHYGAHDRLVMT